MFEPSTTPTLTSLWPDSRVTDAEQISVASAPSAMTTPSRPSENRKRTPMHSSAAVRRMLAQDITATATRKPSHATDCFLAR